MVNRIEMDRAELLKDVYDHCKACLYGLLDEIADEKLASEAHALLRRQTEALECIALLLSIKGQQMTSEDEETDRQIQAWVSLVGESEERVAKNVREAQS